VDTSGENTFWPFLKLYSWWLDIKLYINVNVCEEIYPIKTNAVLFQAADLSFSEIYDKGNPTSVFWSYGSSGFSVLEVNCGSWK